MNLKRILYVLAVKFMITLFSLTAAANSSGGAFEATSTSGIQFTSDRWYLINAEDIAKASGGCFPSNTATGYSNTADIRNYMYAIYGSGEILPGDTVELVIRICESRETFGNKINLTLVPSKRPDSRALAYETSVRAVLHDGTIMPLNGGRTHQTIHTRVAGEYRVLITNNGRRSIFLDTFSMMYESYD